MVFEVEELAVRLIEALRPLALRIRARDRALADQLSRAASSVALNIGEGNYSDPGNRRARFFTAAGSANETRLALRVAVAWGLCAAAEAETALLLQACLEHAVEAHALSRIAAEPHGAAPRRRC